MNNSAFKKLLLITQLAVSSTGLSSVTDKKCIADENDGYDLGYVMDVGPNKGECMSTKARPVFQTEESLERPIFKKNWQVANISHRGEFYTAEIPVRGIEKVIFQVETFEAPVPAAHTQIRIKFYDHSPVLLKNQNSASSSREAVTHDLVLSVEAIGEKGYNYDIFKGLGKNLKTVYRIKTLESFVDRVIVGKGSKVMQWELDLNKSEKMNFLKNYINYSAKKGFSDVYNTIKLNCTTELLRIVDMSTKNTFRKGLGKLLTFDFYPAAIKPAVKSRGIYKKSLDDLGEDPSIFHMLKN